MAGRPRTARPATLAGAIGERIEQLRVKRAWTSADLAETSSVGIATIIQLEGGRSNPKAETLAALALAFGMTPAKMLAGVKGWDR